eukprot:461141_1
MGKSLSADLEDDAPVLSSDQLQSTSKNNANDKSDNNVINNNIKHNNVKDKIQYTLHIPSIETKYIHDDHQNEIELHESDMINKNHTINDMFISKLLDVLNLNKKSFNINKYCNKAIYGDKSHNMVYLIVFHIFNNINIIDCNS